MTWSSRSAPSVHLWPLSHQRNEHFSVLLFTGVSAAFSSCSHLKHSLSLALWRQILLEFSNSGHSSDFFLSYSCMKPLHFSIHRVVLGLSFLILCFLLGDLRHSNINYYPFIFPAQISYPSTRFVYFTALSAPYELLTDPSNSTCSKITLSPPQPHWTCSSKVSCQLLKKPGRHPPYSGVVRGQTETVTSRWLYCDGAVTYVLRDSYCFKVLKCHYIGKDYISDFKANIMKKSWERSWRCWNWTKSFLNQCVLLELPKFQKYNLTGMG